MIVKQLTIKKHLWGGDLLPEAFKLNGLMLTKKAPSIVYSKRLFASVSETNEEAMKD